MQPPTDKPEAMETAVPPEPEFFDAPNIKGKGLFVKGFFANANMRMGAAVVVIVLVGILFLYPRSKKKSSDQHAVKDEKRITVTTTTMERAIDASSNAKKLTVQNRDDLRAREEKRKFNSAMAVLVPKAEKTGDALSQRVPRREEITLGLPSGTKIPSLISSRVFSFNVEAPVIAVVAKDYAVKDKVVIPKNSQFLGQADVVKSWDRINVRFDLLILPDGRELKIRALALSEDGSAGIQGKVDKHTDRKVMKAIGETLLAGASMFAGARQTDPYSLEDQMRMNLAQNLTNEASRDLRSTRIEKSITVEAYTSIHVMLLESV